MVTNQNNFSLQNAARTSKQNLMKHYGILHWLSLVNWLEISTGNASAEKTGANLIMLACFSAIEFNLEEVAKDAMLYRSWKFPC